MLIINCRSSARGELTTPRDERRARAGKPMRLTGRKLHRLRPYGVGAYGALGYAYQPDLSSRCDADYRGYVRDVDIMRRR